MTGYRSRPDCRTGSPPTEEEVAKFDQLLHDLVKKGQSVHAVMVNNASLFTFCEKSAYRYINGGLLMTKRHHLPRACSIKPRRGDKPVEARVDKACRIGREYSAWQKTHVERGHEFIRYVLPKATPYTEAASFDDLTQEDGGK